MKLPTTNTDGRESGDDGLSIIAYTYARTEAGEWAQECFTPQARAVLKHYSPEQVRTVSNSHLRWGAC